VQRLARDEKRQDNSRQLIRIWVGKFEAGALDDDVQAADLIQEYEARIAALERIVGRQALEIELLKRLSCLPSVVSPYDDLARASRLARRATAFGGFGLD